MHRLVCSFLFYVLFMKSLGKEFREISGIYIIHFTVSGCHSNYHYIHHLLHIDLANNMLNHGYPLFEHRQLQVIAAIQLDLFQHRPGFDGSVTRHDPNLHSIEPFECVAVGRRAR